MNQWLFGRGAQSGDPRLGQPLGLHTPISHHFNGREGADNVRGGASGRGLQPFRSGPFKGRGQQGGRSERLAGAKMAVSAAGPGSVEAPSSLLLVVGGECGCPGLLAYVLEELERGRAGPGTRCRGGGRGGASRPKGRGMGRGAAGSGGPGAPVPLPLGTGRRQSPCVPAEETAFGFGLGCSASSGVQTAEGIRAQALGPTRLGSLGNGSASRPPGPPRILGP